VIDGASGEVVIDQAAVDDPLGFLLLLVSTDGVGGLAIG